MNNICLSLLICLFVTSCSSWDETVHPRSPEAEYLSTRRRPCIDEDMKPSHNCFITKKDHDTLSYFSEEGQESIEYKFKKSK